MAGERWGRASFPGVAQVHSCEYTVSHGVLPGTAVLTIAPQLSFEAAGGDLVLFDGIGSVVIRGCKVEKHTFERTDQGYLWRLSLVDRRWKWAFGHISGTYNVRDVFGNLIERTTRTPRQLAELCFLAAGEAIFNVDALTDDPIARPLVNWDYDNPMAALEDLAEQYGCRVVFDPLTNAPFLARSGVGALLPAGPVMEDSLTIDPPERPDTIKLVCGPTRTNAWLVLEAVGQDTDGRIKPIDDLSYAPELEGWQRGWGATKWQFTFPPEFRGMAIYSEETRALARESVFRWYRVTNRSPITPSDDKAKLNVPLVGKIQDYRQLLPLEDSLAQTVLSQFPFTQDASPIHDVLPTLVQGIFYGGQASLDPGEENLDQRPYIGSYSIDKENGVVKFDDYVFRRNSAATGGISTPDLYLLTGITVRDPLTNGLLRYERVFFFGPPQSGTQPKVIKHDEFRLAVIPEYDSGYEVEVLGNGQPDILTNQDDINELADFYLQGAAAEYQQPLPQTVQYAGIHPVHPDGAIQQITWEVGGGRPCTTKASRNTEHQLFLLYWRERRRLVSRGKSLSEIRLITNATNNNPSLTAANSPVSVMRPR